MQSDTRVTNRYICLMGKIQPAMLDKLLNDQLQRAGLAARFLPSYGEKNWYITTKAERNHLGKKKERLEEASVINNV